MRELTRLIWEDMRPALGVTEPGAIAFAAATARARTAGELREIRLRLNSGLFKNAFTCGIPGSGQVGAAHAAALGAVGGRPGQGSGVSGRRHPQAGRTGEGAGGCRKGPGGAERDYQPHFH